jgi:hypothetical protein
MKFNKIIEAITVDNANDLFNRLEHGAMYIEFMKDKSGIKIIAKFDSGTNWFLNYGGKKNPVYFDSLKDFISHIKKSIFKRYESDVKNVYKYVFDPKSMDRIFRQITEFIESNQLKSRSLTFDKSHAKIKEKDSDWDMVIRFRRSAEEASRNQNFRIIPRLTGEGKFGKIIRDNEIEAKWPRRELKKHIANY